MIRSSALKLRRVCITAAEFAVAASAAAPSAAALDATAARAVAVGPLRPGAAVLGAVVLGAIVLGTAAPGAAPCLAAEPGADTSVVTMSGAAASVGAAVFANRCAVCHGPQAAGIPGAFPSLHEQVVAFARIPEGRDYLVMVVTTGLMGSLKVGGVSYNGVMPAQSGLGEAEVAAVLSYLASDLGKNESGTAALSATDVTDARARHPDKSAQATRSLRPATDL